MSKDQKPNTDQRQFWQMVLETFTSSGLSVRQFCQQEGVSEPAFYSWRKKLSAKNKGPSISSPKEDDPASDNFIQISLPAGHSSPMELVLASGHMLRIPSGMDRQTLILVFSALSETGLC